MEDEVKTEETKEGKEEEKPVLEKPLDKMTATELRQVAMEIPEITGAHAMKKEDLLSAIKKAKGIEDEKPARKAVKKVAAATSLSVRELKQKIVTLKAEKKAARDSKDKKKLEALRRRINRAKKMTRRVGKA